MYSSFQPKPVRKKKPTTSTSTANAPAQKGSAGAGAYTSTNTTSNSRAGMKYRTETRPGGVVHVYANGERVFVKKKKNSNPSRSLGV